MYTHNYTYLFSWCILLFLTEHVFVPDVFLHPTSVFCLVDHPCLHQKRLQKVGKPEAFRISVHHGKECSLHWHHHAWWMEESVVASSCGRPSNKTQPPAFRQGLDSDGQFTWCEFSNQQKLWWLKLWWPIKSWNTLECPCSLQNLPFLVGCSNPQKPSIFFQKSTPTPRASMFLQDVLKTSGGISSKKKHRQQTKKKT